MERRRDAETQRRRDAETQRCRERGREIAAASGCTGHRAQDSCFHFGSLSDACPSFQSGLNMIRHDSGDDASKLGAKQSGACHFGVFVNRDGFRHTLKTCPLATRSAWLPKLFCGLGGNPAERQPRPARGVGCVTRVWLGNTSSAQPISAWVRCWEALHFLHLMENEQKPML